MPGVLLVYWLSLTLHDHVDNFTHTLIVKNILVDPFDGRNVIVSVLSELQVQKQMTRQALNAGRFFLAAKRKLCITFVIVAHRVIALMHCYEVHCLLHLP